MCCHQTHGTAFKNITEEKNSPFYCQLHPTLFHFMENSGCARCYQTASVQRNPPIWSPLLLHLYSPTQPKQKHPFYCRQQVSRNGRRKRCMRASVCGTNLSHLIECHPLLLSLVDSAGSYRTGDLALVQRLEMLIQTEPKLVQKWVGQARTCFTQLNTVYLYSLTQSNAISFYFLPTKHMRRCSKTLLKQNFPIYCSHSFSLC